MRIRYQIIAELLRSRVVEGEFPPGRVLPSEASLVKEYQASRVTIRKALELLRSEGLLESRQGFGWMVARDSVPQLLTGLATIEAQLEASGRTPERRIDGFSFVDSPPQVARHLGSRALEVRRVNLADGEPFARVTVWCREDLGANLSRSEVARSSFYELLPIKLGGAAQTIGAAVVSDADAALLAVPPGSAVLIVQRVTRSIEGDPVLVAEHVFPGHLTEFVVDLPGSGAAQDSDPAGLRLVAE